MENDLLSLIANVTPYQASQREVFGDERTCSNCQLYSTCWGGNITDGTPERFQYRNGWDRERYINHMKGVIGQVCGAFNPGDTRRREHFQRADARRIQEQRTEENGWDTEENQ